MSEKISPFFGEVPTKIDFKSIPPTITIYEDPKYTSELVVLKTTGITVKNGTEHDKRALTDLAIKFNELTGKVMFFGPGFGERVESLPCAEPKGYEIYIEEDGSRKGEIAIEPNSVKSEEKASSLWPVGLA
jgi:hypothetical protein